MSSWRKFVLVAVALALVASGLSWGGSAMGAAMDAEPSAVAQASASTGQHGACHGEDETATQPQPGPAPMDCCDGAGCACSCLQHAPVVFALAASLASVTPQRPVARERPVVVRYASGHPQLRPPIG